MRINSRGVRFIAGDGFRVVLTSSSSSSRSQPLASSSSAAKWIQFKCAASTRGLCEIEPVRLAGTGGDNATLHTAARSLVFPNMGVPAYVTHGREVATVWPLLSTATGRCPETRTGRTASALDVHSGPNGAYNSATIPRWDISLCNVLGVGGDYFFVPDQGVLHVLLDPISVQMLTVISILTIYMAVMLAHNLERVVAGGVAPKHETEQNVVRPADAAMKPDAVPAAGVSRGGGWLINVITTVFGMLALLVCAIFPTGSPEFMQTYITREDQVSFVALVVYVLYYTVRITAPLLMAAVRAVLHHMNSRGSGGGVLDNKPSKSLAPVNPIIATLSIVSLRLYSTLDNTYTLFFTALITTRLVHKIGCIFTASLQQFEQDDVDNSMLEEQDLIPRSFDALLDSAIISVMVYAGVVPQCDHDPCFTALCVIQGLFGAITVSRAVLLFENGL